MQYFSIIAPSEERTMMTAVAFNRSLLEGDTAFYLQNSNFWEAPTVKYTWNSALSKSDQKVIKIFKLFLKTIFCIPLALYTCVHILVRKLIVQSSWSLHQKKYLKTCRSLEKQLTNNDDENPFKFKRITFEVDGQKIDGAIIGKKETLENGRWILASNGAQGFYESKLLKESDFQQILDKSHSNGLIFNYPGVAKSKGVPTRDSLAKAYCAMLAFLEDKEKGIGANEIIGYGHSLGAGIQADVLKKHPMQKKIKYVWIKSRSFAAISRVAWPFAYLVKILGWNIDSFNSSKRLRAPEIILQTSVNEKIIHDGVIRPNASLAQALIRDGTSLMSRKKIVSVEEKHTHTWKPETVQQIAEAIEESLENYPKDSHINMRDFKPYIQSKPLAERAKVISEIFNEAKDSEIKATVSIFGVRKIRLLGAGSVSLNWLFNQAKGNKELTLNLQKYYGESSKELSKRNRLTQCLAKIQDLFFKPNAKA